MISGNQMHAEARVAFSREASVFNVSVPAGTTTGSIGLMIPCGHSTAPIRAMVRSTQQVTVFLRYYAANRLITSDQNAGTCNAHTALGTDFRISSLLVGSGAQEVELLITNATGSAATVTAWIQAI